MLFWLFCSKHIISLEILRFSFDSKTSLYYQACLLDGDLQESHCTFSTLVLVLNTCVQIRFLIICISNGILKSGYFKHTRNESFLSAFLISLMSFQIKLRMLTDCDVHASSHCYYGFSPACLLSFLFQHTPYKLKKTSSVLYKNVISVWRISSFCSFY